jgi:glutathione synthase/RimK-type ligase-like ATP-grasp enzyme
VKTAPLVGLEAELIGPDALERLPEFDGLFNRASPEGIIYEFLRSAESLGMPVIDDPESVLKCGNKVFMQELMNRHRIATPRTLIVQRGNVEEVVPTLGLPCVLKLPDSGFGLDVVKIESEDSLRKETERFFNSRSSSSRRNGCRATSTGESACTIGGRFSSPSTSWRPATGR